MVHCPHCGAQLNSPQDTVCPRCGQPLGESPGSKTTVGRDHLADQSTVTIQAKSTPTPDSSTTTKTTVPLGNPDPIPTTHLEDADVQFAPLPVGALVPKEGPPRYSVLEVVSEGPTLNVYRAQTLAQVVLCSNPDCAWPQNQPGETICAACGSQLTAPPVNLSYLLKESSDPDAFATQLHIRQLGLTHPALLLYDAFRDIPYADSARYYLLEPDPGPTLAATLPVPQEVPRVLNWGIQLADGLAYLHSHNLVWSRIDNFQVALEEKRARWTNFNTRPILPEERAQANAFFAQDTQALARLLFNWCTGLQQYRPTRRLPEPVSRMCGMVLGPSPSITNAADLKRDLQAVLQEVSRPISIRLTSASLTHVGNVRELNQDSLLTQEMALVHRSVSQALGLYVVADGMGGHSAGDVASGIAVNVLAQKMAIEVISRQVGYSSEKPRLDPQGWLAEAFAAANAAVYGERRQTHTDMGTTLVVALVIDDVAHIGHVGDSRVYVLDDDNIRQITTDHSLVERLIASGQITREEARIHPQRNVIYRTIGDKSRVEVDLTSYHLSPGECLLLCSDGLSGKVEDDDMWRIVVNSPSLPEACRRLIDAANAAGGDDNITAIIIQFEHG